MAYIINKYNGNQVTVVADGTIDTTLDIKLIGKNYAGYGEAQNENIVFLLENFANVTPPSRAISGQIWFDSGTKKLKFYDSLKWRTTGGAEVGSTQPTGLTEGDFWWDTSNQQLNAWNGSQFVLVGPQSSGNNITEMRTRTVKATSATGGENHTIIEAVVDGTTVFIINKRGAFDLDASTAISGFTTVHSGITLINTDVNGVTDAAGGVAKFRLFGTSASADSLNISDVRYDAAEFIRANHATFTAVVNFADVGYTVGNPVAKLKVFNDPQNQSIPTIVNTNGDTIIFSTTVNNITKTPFKLKGSDILAGENLISNIGSITSKFSTVFANVFSGTATQADSLNVGGTYKTASSTVSSGTIVARTSADQSINGINVTAGSILANYFVGTATTAYYADLAEKYLADEDYDVGTVVMVGGDREVTAGVLGARALGTVSKNPAYMMNSELEGGIYIALKGRVPVKVAGKVSKGDRLVAANGGVACVAGLLENVFAIALESNTTDDVKIVEAVIL